MSTTDDAVVLYQSPDGSTSLAVHLEKETVWLTQSQLAELFAVKTPAINKHLKNIFAAGELAKEAVISILETTAADGKNYKTRYYSLDAIIAVGYRVNSDQATRFRQWATQVLRDHIVKGYSARCLERFARFFGLVENERSGNDRYSEELRVRKLPLLDQVVQFHL